MNGQELPIVVLRHTNESGSTQVEDFERRSPSQPADDPFMHTHQSLAQCIAEAHQIARTMFPLRKPCNCSNRSNSKNSTSTNVGIGKVSHGLQQVAITESCPPSHDWSPPPIVNASCAVLPDTTPLGLYGVGNSLTVGYTSHGGADANVYSTLQGVGRTRTSSPGVGGMYLKNGSGKYNGYMSGNTIAATGGVYGNNVHPTAYPNGSGSSTSRATSVGQCPPGNGKDSGGNSEQGLYSPYAAVLPTSRPSVKLPPSTSKIGAVNTINFELGALSVNNNQSFMHFY